ncbi:MAG: hypothetical protein P4L74_06455 [Candidatus Doudnabacteria bacterium]|nr:hypothetical protein [Candidatus Doudnabacteria bacterium]
MRENNIPEPNLSESHKNLSPEINDLIATAEIEGGITTDKIPPGGGIEIQTANTKYTLTNQAGEFYIQGHPIYCREATKIKSIGSKIGSSNRSIKSNFIGIDMRLEFIVEGANRDENGMEKPIITSNIEKIKELPPADK